MITFCIFSMCFILWCITGIILVVIDNKINKEDNIVHWGILGPVYLLIIVFNYIQNIIDNE